MIHLLPHLEEQIITQKTPENIYMILKAVTDSRIIASSASAEFIGQVHPTGFRIVPKINYKNSFLPVLTGNIVEREGETAIDITLRMHMLVRIFLTVWFGMACFFFLCGILAVITGGLEEIALSLVALGFIVFGQILVRCGFYRPARRALTRLKELLC